MSIQEGYPPVFGATRWDIFRTRLAARLNNFLNKTGIPGAIQPFSWNDPVTGNMVIVTVKGGYTRLSVNGRDYYFDRITGSFDGTGMGCS